MNGDNSNEIIEEFRRNLNSIIDELKSTRSTNVRDDTVKGNLINFGITLAHMNQHLVKLTTKLEETAPDKQSMQLKDQFIAGDIEIKASLLPKIVPDYASSFAQQVSTLLLKNLTNKNEVEKTDYASSHLATSHQ